MRAAVLLMLVGAAVADEAGIAKAQEIAKAGPAAAREAIPELIAIGRGSPWERFAARDALAIAGPPAVGRLIEGASGDGSLRLLLEGVSFDLGAGVVAPALPLLASEDPKVRAMAAVSLGAAGKGGEAAVKALVAALHDKDAEVRRESANALGLIGRGAHDAIPGLIHLANDPERGCQREALLAMGAILRDAAERERPAPKLSPEVANAIERGLAWLAAQQQPGGHWPVPPAGDARVPDQVRTYVAAVAALAMLDGGAPNAHSSQVRAGLRFVVAGDTPPGEYEFREPWWIAREAITTTLFVATRVLRDPEARAASQRGATASPTEEGLPGQPAWQALVVLEGCFAGLLDPKWRVMAIDDAGAVNAVLWHVAAGNDPRSDKDRWVDSCRQDNLDMSEPEWHAFTARARWYGGAKSDVLVEIVLKGQREDGSWEPGKNALGAAHTTSCMLLCLKAAAGLAHPLTMPLPDAPQLKAAVATLRIAAQSKDAGIKAAAEQALAGFAVR